MDSNKAFPILEFSAVSKAFPTAGGLPTVALDSVSLTLEPGAVAAIVGRSGSGKSTLLNLAAGIDVPTSGTLRWEGRPVNELTDAERARARRAFVGIVFQFFHLLPHLTVFENVVLPGLIDGADRARATARTRELLVRVGLEERAEAAVDTLSGGEMQRVAICRALFARPKLLLADEPTGNLDDDTAKSVMDLMLSLRAEHGASLLIVTHSAEVAALADRVFELHSGRLVE